MAKDEKRIRVKNMPVVDFAASVDTLWVISVGESEQDEDGNPSRPGTWCSPYKSVEVQTQEIPEEPVQMDPAHRHLHDELPTGVSEVTRNESGRIHSIIHDENTTVAFTPDGRDFEVVRHVSPRVESLPRKILRLLFGQGAPART